MYKIGASFDPENARMVDVSELHNLDYGFEAYATKPLTLLMVAPWQLAGWVYQTFLTHLTVLTTKEPSH